MTVEVINPPELAEPKGYNNGIKIDKGSLVFVAGQIGWDQERRIVSDNFAGQFSQALENVLAVVKAAGGTAESIARLLIFVTDKKEYLSSLKDVGVAYSELMGKHFPAMSLVEVKDLLEPDAKVEIEAMAVV